MKTLFITHHYIDSPGGGSYASLAYINAFADLSDSFILLYPSRGKTPYYINSKVSYVPVKNEKSKISKFIDLLLGRVHRYFGIAEKYLDADFDTVVFDTSVASYRLISKFKNKGKRVICIHHNYQYEYFRDNVSSFLKIPTLFWCKRYEGQAVRQSDLNLVLTNQDEELLRLHYGQGNEAFGKIGVFEYEERPLPVIPNEMKNDVQTFVITGSLNSRQTEFSLIPWLDSFYPRLRDKCPNHKLLIAGRNPSNTLYEACRPYPEITIIPNPERMEDILSCADYYICPTSLGGGLKLRIMDGLRYGLPVCTHVVSARGYDSFDGNCLFAYSDEKSFDDALSQMIDCHLSKEEITEKYCKEFSFKSGINRIKNVIKTSGITPDF